MASTLRTLEVAIASVFKDCPVEADEDTGLSLGSFAIDGSVLELREELQDPLASLGTLKRSCGSMYKAVQAAEIFDGARMMLFVVSFFFSFFSFALVALTLL